MNIPHMISNGADTFTIGRYMTEFCVKDTTARQQNMTLRHGVPALLG